MLFLLKPQITSPTREGQRAGPGGERLDRLSVELHELVAHAPTPVGGAADEQGWIGCDPHLAAVVHNPPRQGPRCRRGPRYRRGVYALGRKAQLLACARASLPLLWRQVRLGQVDPDEAKAPERAAELFRCYKVSGSVPKGVDQRVPAGREVALPLRLVFPQRSTVCTPKLLTCSTAQEFAPCAADPF